MMMQNDVESNIDFPPYNSRTDKERNSLAKSIATIIFLSIIYMFFVGQAFYLGIPQRWSKVETAAWVSEKLADEFGSFRELNFDICS